MNLEEQVCSLELAKRLKELNVEQDSLFCWINNCDLEYLPLEIRNKNVVYAAFTVAELGEMLPNFNVIYTLFDRNEANARAKILIYLIENKLI
jgi:hypothetical protein